MNTFQIIQSVFWAITALGVWFTWKTFEANRKIKRAEWLRSLYEKFYENDHYKTVRRWIDFDRLASELKSDSSHEKEEKLSDFLNFFEFIATLEKMKQLNVEEIHDLFAYYLNRIRSSELCMNYVQSYKFKNLEKLLYKSFSSGEKG